MDTHALRPPGAGSPPDEVVRIGDHSYVLAVLARADERTRVLKHDDTLGVFDERGDILAERFGDQGLYHEGMRHLSRMDLSINGLRPLVLTSGVDDANILLAVDLTNPDLSEHERIRAPRGTLHIRRSALILDSVLHHRLTIQNFGLAPIDFQVGLRFAADFADMFEVRGVHRRTRGERLPTAVTPHGLEIAYSGLDRVERRTRINCTPAPARTRPDRIDLELRLEPGEQHVCDLRIACAAGHVPPEPPVWNTAVGRAADRVRAMVGRECVIRTSNLDANDWITRSRSDLQLMISQTPHGPYPYAGIPWFSTPFGRDGIITALQTLWMDPETSRGVLAFLALTQSDTTNPAIDAEPGKIVHEIRHGEMAATGEVPYGRYYGSVDATPLFVMLAGEYLRVTGDLSFIESLWPNVERALDWICGPADRDHDGFVEYHCRASGGLDNQGWKDSRDSVFHADGSLAAPPIALCEVQGYVYAALRAAGEIAAALGRRPSAEDLERRADQLRDSFAQRFWDEQLGTYVLALDSDRRPCRVAASNAGHCLFTGIARDDHARRIAADLLSPRFFSGWGIRTLGADQPRYNPMSYHNGSVWPHDTALAAYGLARYGNADGAARLMEAMFGVARRAEGSRLPELFCGFDRPMDGDGGRGPVRYPVACSPQAWAAGAVFLMLQACLGLRLQGARGEIHFHRPSLPPFLDSVELHNLRAGAGTADILIHRHTNDVAVNILRRDPGVRVVVMK